MVVNLTSRLSIPNFYYLIKFFFPRQTWVQLEEREREEARKRSLWIVKRMKMENKTNSLHGMVMIVIDHTEQSCLHYTSMVRLAFSNSSCMLCLVTWHL